MTRKALLLLIVAAGLTTSTRLDLPDLEDRSTELSSQLEDLNILLPRGKFKGKSVANRLSAHTRKVAGDASTEDIAKSPSKTVPSAQVGQGTSDASAVEAAKRLTKTAPSLIDDPQRSHSSSKYESPISRGSSADGAQDLLHSYLHQQRSSSIDNSSTRKSSSLQSQRSSRPEGSGRSTPAGAPTGTSSRTMLFAEHSETKAGLMMLSGQFVPGRRLDFGTPSGRPSGQPAKAPGTQQRRPSSGRGTMPGRTYSTIPSRWTPRRPEQEPHIMSERLGELLQVPPGPVHIPLHDTSRHLGSGHQAAGPTSSYPHNIASDRAHFVTGHVNPLAAVHSMVAPQYGQGYMPPQPPLPLPQHMSMPSSYGPFSGIPPPPWEEPTPAQRLAMDPQRAQHLLSVVKDASNRNTQIYEERRAERSRTEMGWGGRWLNQRPFRPSERSSITEFWTDSMEFGRGGFPNLLDPNRPSGTHGTYGSGANPRLSPRHVIFKRDLSSADQQQPSFGSPLSTRTNAESPKKTTLAASSPSTPKGRRGRLHRSYSPKPQEQADQPSRGKKWPAGGPSGKSYGPPLSVAERLSIVGGPSRASSRYDDDTRSQPEKQSGIPIKDGLSPSKSAPSFTSNRYSSTDALTLEPPRRSVTPHPALAYLPESIEGSASPRWG